MTPLTGLRILVVDDSKMIQSALHKMLTQMGALVRVATNGKEGVQFALENPPPQIILSDVTMPEMSGFDMCQLLKTQAAVRHIPVVFLSALDDTKNLLTGMRVGAADYLAKTNLKPEHLATVLLRAYEKSKTKPETPAEGTPFPTPSRTTPPLGSTRDGIEREPEDDELPVAARIGFVLQRGEDAHMGMMKNAQVGVFVFNLHRQLIYMNRRAAKALGMAETSRASDVPRRIHQEILEIGISIQERGGFNKEFFVFQRFASGSAFHIRLECLTTASNEMSGVMILTW